MEETKEQGPSLGVLIAILAALVVGVILIFAMLEIAIPKVDIPETPVQSESVVPDETMPLPSFCPHCGDKLPSSFRWEQFCPYCGEPVRWEAER